MPVVRLFAHLDVCLCSAGRDRLIGRIGPSPGSMSDLQSLNPEPLRSRTSTNVFYWAYSIFLCRKNGRRCHSGRVVRETACLATRIPRITRTHNERQRGSIAICYCSYAGHSHPSPKSWMTILTHPWTCSSRHSHVSSKLPNLGKWKFEFPNLGRQVPATFHSLVRGNRTRGSHFSISKADPPLSGTSMLLVSFNPL